MENLSTSLLISAIGMGLVFGAIVLFWVFMAALVRLVREEGDREATETNAAQTEALSAARLAASEADLRRRAAIAAVITSLAEQEASSVKPFPLPQTAFVSSWQAVMRARQLGERGTMR